MAQEPMTVELDDECTTLVDVQYSSNMKPLGAVQDKVCSIVPLHHSGSIPASVEQLVVWTGTDLLLAEIVLP